MQAIELYLQCLTVTSFLFAVILMFLFLSSKYVKTLETHEKKSIHAIHESQESIANQTRFSEVEDDHMSVEITRCLNTTKSSTIGVYNYTLYNDSLFNNQTQYFDITCCNQESLPCQRHDKLPVQCCISNESNKY